MYKNREDQRKAERKSYHKNIDRSRARIRKNNTSLRQRNADFVKNFLKSNPCIDCGNDDIRVLEFDHVKEIKFKNISDMIRLGYSIKKIETEIKKCEVRCANCHRIVTYERRLVSKETNSVTIV